MFAAQADGARSLAEPYAAAKLRWPGLKVEVDRLVESMARLEIDAPRLARSGLDLILAHAAAAADPAAVAALEQEVLTPTRGVIRRYARDGAQTDEVMQQLRIHLLVPEASAAPRLARFDGRAALGAWVRMCGVRLALHTLRHERARRDISIEWSEALAALPAADPLVETLRIQHANRVAAVLQDACLALPQRQRAIVRLVFVDGASVDEVAAMYQVHRVTVWRWMQESRAALAASIRAQLHAAGSSDEAGTASLVAWVHDQVELSLDDVLASTVTSAGR